MAAPVTIALDAMGGDYGPRVVVAGAAISLVRHPGLRFILVGDRAAIDQASREVGAAAVDIILGQINRHERGAPAIPKTVLIPGRWIEGRTVRPPPV